jgi:hypothetical protein
MRARREGKTREGKAREDKGTQLRKGHARQFKTRDQELYA